MCVRMHRNSHSVAFAEACNVTRDVYDFAGPIHIHPERQRVRLLEEAVLLL